MNTHPWPVASSVHPLVPISQHSVSGIPVRNVVTTESAGIFVADLSSRVSKDPGPQDAGLFHVPNFASALVRVGFFCNISATTPATAGEEKLVPLMNRYWNGAAEALSGVALLAQVRTLVEEMTCPS